MNTNSKPSAVADNIVVSMDYMLTVDGQVVDSSEDSEPIEFIQGFGNIIPGLEKSLYGMTVDESKTVVVSAKDGYGEIDNDAVVAFPRKEFPEDIPMEIGIELQVQNEDGTLMTAVIREVGKDSVTLDFNHPLAGKELTFQVTITDLREATEEEIEHGHVHGDDMDDEDFDFIDFDLEDELDEEEFEENDEE